MSIVTPEFISNYLATHTQEQITQFVGRALVVIFNNQLEDEKVSNETKHQNGIGFTGGDAFGGTLTAKSFLKHKTLQDWQVEKWTRKTPSGRIRIAKYWRQLDAAAQSKKAA